ncbi:MAG: DUF1761 domain-containing protein [Chitinophagales bacterium]|nr:DUF1761 domain-containing protein [Chitinophagales bacterium]MDW8393698.1 DUF1761 domain-containing protein [Chitinophagales bacterium]
MRNAILYLNWPMVLAVTAGYFALGLLWYNVLFGKYWSRVNHLEAANPQNRIWVLGRFFVLLFVICTVVGLMLNAIRCKEMSDCFIRSYILIAGLVCGLVGATLNAQRKPFAIWFIDITYHLLGTLLATLVLSRWGMTGSAY